MSTESMKRWRQRHPEHNARLVAGTKRRLRERTAPHATNAGLRWTPAEDQALLDNLDKTTTELALALGRSYSSVEARLHKLRHRSPATISRNWTPADDQALIDGAGATARELGLVLGRSPAAVSVRRSILRKKGLLA